MMIRKHCSQRNGAQPLLVTFRTLWAMPSLFASTRVALAPKQRTAQVAKSPAGPQIPLPDTTSPPTPSSEPAGGGGNDAKQQREAIIALVRRTNSLSSDVHTLQVDLKHQTEQSKAASLTFHRLDQDILRLSKDASEALHKVHTLTTTVSEFELRRKQCDKRDLDLTSSDSEKSSVASATEQQGKDIRVVLGGQQPVVNGSSVDEIVAAVLSSRSFHQQFVPRIEYEKLLQRVESLGSVVSILRHERAQERQASSRSEVDKPTRAATTIVHGEIDECGGIRLNSSQVLVRNVPLKLSAAAIRMLFSSCGLIQSVCVTHLPLSSVETNSKGTTGVDPPSLQRVVDRVFQVTFATASEASSAIERFHGYPVASLVPQVGSPLGTGSNSNNGSNNNSGIDKDAKLTVEFAPLTDLEATLVLQRDGQQLK